LILRDIKIQFEERFQHNWTSLSIQYHFKSIVNHLLAIPFNEVNLNLNKTIEVEFAEEFERISDELLTDKPLQYVLGETIFRDCRLFCGPEALIPRPETEELVDLILEEVKKIKQPKILDIGTGTGCIAISIQQERPDSKVFAMDKFKGALDLAIKNNIENDTNVSFHQVDALVTKEMTLFETNDFDVWVSNPPYIPTKDKVLMDKNVLDFEPDAALFVSDEDPLLFYREIAISAHRGLKKGGLLFYEIHEDFGQETIDLLMSLGFKDIRLISDLQGKNRMVSAMKNGNG